MQPFTHFLKLYNILPVKILTIKDTPNAVQAPTNAW